MHEKEFSCRWISDGIGDEYKEWRLPNKNGGLAARVFIESATGTGKTRFVLDKIIPEAIMHHLDVLYLGNRTALIKQMIVELEKKLNNNAYEANKIPLLSSCDSRAAFQVWNKQATFSDVVLSRPSQIIVLGYQAVEGFLNKFSEFFDPTHFNGYVIMDEAHFFLEDSLFNPWTYRILFETIPQFSHSTYIFISATIQESRKILSAASYESRVPASIIELKELMKKDGDHIWNYKNHYQVPEYRLIQYTKNSDLIYAIQNRPKDEKWLIFVSSKRRGTELKNLIKEKADRKVSFFYSEKKHTKEWEKIIINERFNSDVLIVTKVLDNGVNIHDSSLKHIVLPFCERVDFMQMLGRRRSSGINEKEIINIYVMFPTIQELNSQLNQVLNQDKTTSAVLDAIYNNHQLKMTRLLQNLWLKGDRYINVLFYLDQHRSLVPNPLAFERVSQRIQFFRSLMNDRSNPKILKAVNHFSKNTPYVYLYFQLVSSWLNSNNNSQLNLTTSSGYCSLQDYLESVGTIDQEKQEEFYQEIQQLLKIECRNRYKDAPDLQSQMAAIRKGKTQRKATINKQLAILGIPYHIKKENNTWVPKQIDLNSP